MLAVVGPRDVCKKCSPQTTVRITERRWWQQMTCLSSASFIYLQSCQQQIFNTHTHARALWAFKLLNSSQTLHKEISVLNTSASCEFHFELWKNDEMATKWTQTASAISTVSNKLYLRKFQSHLIDSFSFSHLAHDTGSQLGQKSEVTGSQLTLTDTSADTWPGWYVHWMLGCPLSVQQD